jgi:DNA-nicking Smr family endonuclease
LHISKTESCLEVDIHGLTAQDAKYRLEHLLTHAGPEIKEIRVIHGYNTGQVLRDMVRVRLKHPRIASKLVTLNPGETRLLLRPAEKKQKR